MKTPQLPYPQLAQALGIAPAELYLKREDEHYFGSHKGRSIPHMIDEYRKKGERNFTISSSGNAALAAILAVQTHNRNAGKDFLALNVFIGKKISPEKLQVLTSVIEDTNIKLKQVENPKQQAFLMDKDHVKLPDGSHVAGKAINLRQSTDDLALTGYHELAEELNHIPNLQAIFIPTSSGTTAQGVAEGFAKLDQHPQIHIVQTTVCHPIAEEFDKSPLLAGEVREHLGEVSSIATAIVDKIAHRKAKVVEAIKFSHGSGWIVTDNEIRAAMKLVEDTCNQIISPNSALSVAGLIKAVQNGWKFEGVVVCLITGR